MSDTYNAIGPAGGVPGTGPGGTGPATDSKRRRRRRGRRIALISVIAVLAVVCGGLASAYVMANRLAGSIHRIPGVVTRAELMASPATKGSMTILVTGNDVVTSRSRPNSKELPSGLMAIVHLNAGRSTGAVVSIPPETLVAVPGHGRTQLENALTFGGPALLVRTVHAVTGDRIDHYAVVNFARVTHVVDALGGVDVVLPRATTSSDYNVHFHKGVNHLNGHAALAYVRQSSLTEDQRVARQQNLLRAILQKIAGQNLLGNPIRAYGIIHAFTQALSVDSSFSNGDLMSLARSARSFRPGHGTFVTVPVQPAPPAGGLPAATFVQPEAGQVWQAIRTDSVAAFARQHPDTVTSSAPQ
jgi:LCP family protein required for cell wall assembly